MRNEEIDIVYTCVEGGRLYLLACMWTRKKIIFIERLKEESYMPISASELAMVYSELISEIKDLKASGKSNVEIAETLNLYESTVYILAQ